MGAVSQKEDEEEESTSPQLALAIYIVIFLWDVGLLLEARTWSDRVDWLFPMIVGIPLGILTLVQIVRFSLKIDRPKGINFGSQIKSNYDWAFVFSWVVSLPFVLYIVGFFFTLPIYLFAYEWYFFRDIRTALGISLSFSALIYALFVAILRVQLWPGIWV